MVSSENDGIPDRAVPRRFKGAVNLGRHAAIHEGIDRMPMPSDISGFLNKHGFNTDELDGYIEDYEYFC